MFVRLGLIGSTKTLHLNDARGIKTGEAPNKPRLEVMSGVHTHDSIENIAHPDNPVLQGEHYAALHLVPEVQATHVAVAAGGWSSRATWRDGQIFQSGSRVLIPEGIAVEVDDQFTAALDWIRINGELRFSTTVDTELWGGAGRDTFWLRSGGGVQRLQDFDVAEDRLVLKKKSSPEIFPLRNAMTISCC